MKAAITNSIECTSLPICSSRELGWKHILVEQFHHPAGEGKTYYSQEHSICLSLAPRPVRLLQIQGNKTNTGVYLKGDFCITPAGIPFFARWDSEDCFLQIRLESNFISSIAEETFNTNSERLELIPQFRTREPQLEAIALMLLSELKENFGAKLYIDSLTNILVVQLLKKYSVSNPVLAYLTMV